MRILSRLSGSRLALGILAMLVMDPAWAEDPVAEYKAIKRSSLRGIESLGVIVLASEGDPGCRQVSDERIQTDVEARLRGAGILIDLVAVSYPFVSVASVEALEELLCGFAVSVELQQARSGHANNDLWDHSVPGNPTETLSIAGHSSFVERPSFRKEEEQ